MSDAPIRAHYRSIAPKRVHYHEVDMQNIVFNANYLMYADVDFRGSAVADDIIDLAVRIKRFGSSSLTSECAIFRGDELLTVVTISYVHFAVATRRPAPLQQLFKDMVAAFEPVRPDGV